MRPLETLVVSDLSDVDLRLASLMLHLDGLLRVVSVARSASANVTLFHAANAAGTYAYQQGTWALRQEFVGDDWRLDRPDNVESIYNQAIRTRVIFCNVDIACDIAHLPRARSQKGAGAERVCSGNLFGSLPHFVKPSSEPTVTKTFYLMVDEDGRAELSKPVVQEGAFTGCIERIFLRSAEPDLVPVLKIDDDGAYAVFDPIVIRK